MSRLKSIGASAADEEEPAKPIVTATTPPTQATIPHKLLGQQALPGQQAPPGWAAPDTRLTAPGPMGTRSIVVVVVQCGRVIMAPERVDSPRAGPTPTPCRPYAAIKL
jgi:hypothetical protein